MTKLKGVKNSIYIVFCLFVISCGGSGGLISTTDKASLSFTYPTKVETNILDESIEVEVKITCSSPDVFLNYCYVKDLEFEWDIPSIDNSVVQFTKSSSTYKIKHLLNLRLEHNKSKNITFELLKTSDRLILPTTYMYDINPSSSVSQYFTDVISLPSYNILGYTTETCVVDEGKTICTVDKTYFGSLFFDYEKGTLQITEGTQNLNESMFGLLSGNGFGTVNQLLYNITFSSAPSSKDLPIVAKYLKPFLPLTFNPVMEDLKIFYGSKSFTVTSGLIKEGNNIVGKFENGELIPLLPWGFQNSPVVATYTKGGVCDNCGGKEIGKGDGVNTVLKLKIPYPYVVKESVKVFTSDQTARVLMVNPLTGDITVEFDYPPYVEQPIKASFILNEYNLPIRIKSKGLSDTINVKFRK